MKKIIFIALLFLNSFANAQNQDWIIVPLEETLNLEYGTRDFTYFKDVNNSLNKFEGTWVYSQGNQYFKITFIKLFDQICSTNSNQKEDILITRYEYKQNGTTVFETYSTNRSFVNWIYMEQNSNKIGMSYTEPSFTHPSKQRIGNLELTYSLNSISQPTLTWVRTDVPITQKPIPYQGYTTCDISNFLTPANMVLIKQ